MVSDTDKGPATCSVSGRMEGGGVMKSMQWGERERLREEFGLQAAELWTAGTIERQQLGIGGVRWTAFCPRWTTVLFCDEFEIRDVKTEPSWVGSSFSVSSVGSFIFSCFFEMAKRGLFFNDRVTPWLDKVSVAVRLLMSGLFWTGSASHE